MRSRPALWLARQKLTTPHHLTRMIAVCGVCQAIWVPTHASGQNKPIEAAITSTLSFVKGGLNSGPRGRDAHLAVQPSLSMAHEGADLRLHGTLGADFIGTARQTGDDRVLPFAQAQATATLWEGVAFVDSAVEVRQAERDPFAARVAQGSAQNASTAVTANLAPTLVGEITPDLSLLGKGSVTWSRYGDNVSEDSRTSQFETSLTHKPRPVGGRLELRSQKIDYAAAGSINDWRLDSARAGPTLSIDGQLVVGLAAGAERTVAPQSSMTDSLYGVSALWAPSSRTDLAATVERRFFGTSWNAAFRHRNPYAAMAVRVISEPLLPGASGAGAPGNLETFLNSILTTRFPDPALRAAQVSEITRIRGFQTSIRGGSGVPGAYAQLGRGAEATVVLLGTRNTLSLSAFQQTISQLRRDDGGAVFNGAPVTDNRQRGANFGVNRRLSPRMSADLSLQWSEISGLAIRSGDMTRESTCRLALVNAVAPRTSLSLGVQYRRSETNVAGLASFREGIVFASLLRRF